MNNKNRIDSKKQNESSSLISMPKVDVLVSKLESLESKQNKILELQKTLLEKEDEILDLEKKMYLIEEQNLRLHEKFEKTNFEKLFGKKSVLIAKTTYKDVIKAVIGAFFGVMGHFAFAKGIDLAQDHSVMRSTFLLLTSFVILILFIYYTGFKDVKPRFFLKLFPIRSSVLYVSALATVVFILFLYGLIDFTTPFSVAYSYVAAVSILAVLGAGTSDLIGSE